MVDTAITCISERPKGTSFILSLGIITVLIPFLLAPYTFSKIPPTGLTFPLRDISPVMAISCLNGLFNKALIIHTVIADPAEGPSIFPPPTMFYMYIIIFNIFISNFFLLLMLH